MCKPRIGITMGDAAGIGSEIVAKTAAKTAFTEMGRPVIIGDERTLKRGMEIAGVDFSYTVIYTIEEALDVMGIALLHTDSIDAYSVEMGCRSRLCGGEAAANLRMAVDYCKSGLLDGICFAPNNKASMKEAGYKFHGAVDLLAGFFGFDGYCSELGVLGNHWTARVTSHIPAREIHLHLTAENILRSIRLLDAAMRLAGFESPRIAVSAFNPHSGENGTCGTEEIEVIEPAVRAARDEGIHADGPFAADTLFMQLFRGDHDGAVTMYHDQGQIAMKLRGFDSGTTIFAGLPAPVTTASHGTAYDVAGKGKAQYGAWESAYTTVCRMAGAAKERSVPV